MSEELVRLMEELDHSREKASEHSISSKINGITENDQVKKLLPKELHLDFAKTI